LKTLKRIRMFANNAKSCYLRPKANPKLFVVINVGIHGGIITATIHPIKLPAPSVAIYSTLTAIKHGNIVAIPAT